MSEVLAAPVEPMDLDDSANLNDADASGDVAEPAPDSTNHSQAEADPNVEEEEELIDIEGIDSPVAFGAVQTAEEDVVEQPAPQKKTRKPRKSTSNSVSAEATESESVSAWQAPPTRRAAKAAMTKLSHDFPAPPPPTKSVKTTPKAVKVVKPEPEVEVKPEKPSRPSTVTSEAVKVGRPMATPKVPQEDEEKPPSKRKVTHRQTRTVKPIGFYDDRFDVLTRRHKATKTATCNLEDAIIEGLEMSDKVLNGQSLIEHIFLPYAKALTHFTEAQVSLRRTIVLERKLAAEVWGDNNIATFRDGVYTVDCEAIEASLTRPQNLPIPGVTRAYNKRTPKPVNRYVEPTPPTTTEKRRRKSERPVKTESETPDTATPQGRSRRKVVPASEPIGPPIKRLKLKKENIPDSPLSSPSVSRSASPIETESRKKAPAPAPSAKPTPMPKFKHVDENLVSKKALPFIKDAPVLSCYCTSDSNGDRCDDNCVNRMLHMECGSRCTDNCRNKRFTNKQYAGFEPFFAGAKGWGIRATKPIRTGDFIVEYVGEVVDPAETKKRLKMYTQKGHKHHYMMGLRNNAVIDATTYGNYSRFVNHSCDPNAETQKWVVHKQMRVGFFAKKNIAPGEEIVFDYAFERFGEAAQVCYCGSKNCTGYIGSKPEPGATGGEVDEDDAASLTEDSDEAEEDEVEPETSAPTPKPKKPKLTEQEKDWRKRCAKARKRLLRWKRDMRRIVGRKKVFSAEDVREFNRQMFNVSEIETRYLLTSYLLTITDESWLKWFVESQGVGIMYTWVTDNLASGKSLRYILRFNVQILELLQRLPVNDPMYFNQLNFLELLKSMSLCILPEETIIAETMNDLVDNVTREAGDEPPIADKDLARVLKKDGISMLDLHDEMRERAKALFDAWSVVKPPPKPPKPPTPQPEPVSEAEEDEFDSYPIRAHTPDSPPPDEVEVLDNPSPQPRKNDQIESEERHERRRSRSADRYDYDRRRNSQSIYRRGKDRRRSRSRSAERSYYGDRRRHGHGGRDDYRHRYRSRSRSPYRDDRYDRYDRGGRYHSSYERRHRSSYHRRTSEERYRYRRGGDRSRSPRRDERPRYTQDTRDLPKLIDVKIELPEHIAYSVFAKTNDMPPPLPPRSPPPVVAPVLTAIAPITPAALQKSSAANLDVTNVFELSGGSTNPRLPLKIHINGSSATDAPPPLLSAGSSKNRRNMPSINLPGTGPKWLPTVQNVGYIAPPPTTSVPMMVPPPSSTGYGFPPPMLSPYMPPVTAISGAFNPSTPSYYHPSPYYPASMFQPPPPPQPVPAPMPITVTVKEEVMDPSPSSVVSDPVHRPQEEPAETVAEDDADGEEAGGAKERVFEANPDWIETSTPDGVIYYYHKETRESMWTEPPPKTPEPANPTPPQCSTDSSQGTSGEATTTSSEFGDSQAQQVPIVQKEVKQELIDVTPTPSNHDSSQQHHHSHHRPPRRSREYPPDMDKRKRDFKEKVWNHLFPYLKTKSGVEGYGSNVLTQYARKMTHRTLDDEIHHGNVKCVVTKEVLAKARHKLDRSFSAFLESNGNIDAV